MGDVIMLYINECFSEKIVELKSKYISCFFAALCSYIIVYGFELTHFTLSIDEEFKDNFLQTLMLGRWGHALLREYVLPEPYVPFFTMMLSIFFLSLAALLSAIFLKLERVQSIAFVVMLAALPQLAYQMEFSNQSDTVAISLMISSASLIAMRAGRFKGWFTFVILTVISLSIYQSIFLYAASLLCVRMTLDSVRGETTIASILKTVFFYSLATLLALMINSAISTGMASAFHAPSSNYLDGMIGWGHKETFDVITTLYLFVKQYITFTNYTGLNSFPFTVAWVAIIIASSFIFRLKLSTIIFCCIITFLSAFSLNLVLGAWLPPRAMAQVPVVFAGLFTVAMVVSRAKYAPLFISLVFLAAGSASSNSLFYSDYMARKSDEQMGREIVSTIYSKYPDFDISRNPVFFYGSHVPFNSWRIPTADVFGSSFFEWDGGNNRRIYAYLSNASIADFTHPNAQQVADSIGVATSLPSWPNRGSVSMQNGVVIVKIGPTLSALNK
ncbi:glucosyltransferase domain-containing protein [Enterobacter roggenkampii]|uniref:glucosyltransferase domain-containing protein n=1 Tax=Enterobacter roggenkampii TaxID=1812935 RepID=UPI001E4C10A5|nr:glucosyltransferase domain-containing protein [Enterobacter roggenkampii]MCC7577996.1 glucosyltransferase domain-containing protein [Enterobacter roggenkampii]MCC7586858.1 glucosyltransferase domain-containing protein [Enterobacter roggenkampii]MCC7591920.1 glucosyltransferase domain-containing protein [Enterobacter roggenkampii]MCC7601486.1 glucosyltransferase domain-containing protein [Enterobacter roggenkampii]MCC7606086.1 glucosyltransferase domain-containing protein [Enterobacter rogge